MSSSDGKATGLTNAVTGSAVALDLALVEAASGVAGRVTVDNDGSDVVWAETRGDSVGDDEATLRVAAESDLGVRALGLGLRDELGHDRTALATHQGIASDRGLVIDTLNGDAIGAEGRFEGRGDGGADRATEVTRLGRATSADEGDRGTFAINDVVAGAAATAAEAELALLDWRSHGDGSYVEQVGHGSGVLHFGGVGNY